MDAKRGLSNRVIGCALQVSRELGPGFLESVYEAALILELEQEGIQVERQKVLSVYYKGSLVGRFVADLLVEERLLIELKAVPRFGEEHKAQLINYLKATGLQVGLLLNFGSPILGIQRVVWGHDDRQGLN